MAEMPAEESRASDHLRKFVESTSVRGVSRILKSSNRVLRVLWALAVVFCAAMLVYQLSRVVNQYLRYEFSTVTKEDIWSHAVRHYLSITEMHKYRVRPNHI